MARVKTSKSYEANSSRATSFGQIEFDKNGVSQDLKTEHANALAKASSSLFLCDEEGSLESTKAIELESETITNKAIVTNDLEADDAPLNDDVTEDVIVQEEVITEEDPVSGSGVVEETTHEITEPIIEEKIEVTDPTEDVITEEVGSETTDDADEEAKAELSQMGLGDIRKLLTDAGVPEEEFAHFKGKENKDALVAFAITKL